MVGPVAKARTMSDVDVQISLTGAAIEKLRAVIDDYPEDVAGLRLKIAGRNASSFEHALTIVEVGYEPEGDAVLELEHFRLYLEGDNLEELNGVSVNYEFKGANLSGLEFTNPNPAWRTRSPA